MNLYIHYVNRFLFSLIAGLVFYACDKTEPTCADFDITYTDETLNARLISTDDETFRYEFHFSGREEVDICDLNFTSELELGAFMIGIEEAVFRSCESCLEILEWYGPDCDPAFSITDEEHTIHNTRWILNEIIHENEIHYPPCFSQVGGTLYENDTAEFFLGNRMWMTYEFQNDQIIFDNTVHMTLVGVTQYESFLEGLFFEHLFNKTPLNYELDNNQLTLTHENVIHFIFYAK